MIFTKYVKGTQVFLKPILEIKIFEDILVGSKVRFLSKTDDTKVHKVQCTVFMALMVLT